MKIATAIVLAAACLTFPADVRTEEARVLPVAIESQVELLSLELPANQTDRVQVGNAMEDFARRYGFKAAVRPNSPLWNIERVYIGPNYVSVLLDLLPEHTFVVLSKRPGDAATHQDLIDALQTTLTPFGFKPWVEPPG